MVVSAFVNFAKPQLTILTGVTKTYRLTYESVEVMHALFDRSSAPNKWTITSGFLREFTDYFSPKAEQLDMYCEDGKMTFLSFTEKVVNAKAGMNSDGWLVDYIANCLSEVLKQPLKTAVSVQLGDFEQFSAQEKMHLIMSVKDFKTIIAHADTLSTSVTAYYSTPGRPLQFNYGVEGIQCQFTLMAAGDYHATPGASAATRMTTRESSRAESRPEISRASIEKSFSAEMPPPAIPKARKLGKNLGQNDSAATSMVSNRSGPESEGLFVTQEEDSQWDPPNYDDGEESLGWNATGDNVRSVQAYIFVSRLTYVQDAVPYPTLRDTGPSASVAHQTNVEDGLVPTQRLSQVRAPLVLNFGGANDIPDPGIVVRCYTPFLLDITKPAITAYVPKTRFAGPGESIFFKTLNPTFET